jgi:hypothetical protein
MVPMSAAKVEPAEPKQITAKGVRQARDLRDTCLPIRSRPRLDELGMTRAQVAELYGVAVNEIDRIIRRPS